MEPNILNYPNSQEGTDAYEADLAEYNRIQKGPMIGTEFVDTVEDVVESGVEQISKVPILRTGLQFLGGAVRTIDQVMSEDQGVGGVVYRTYKNVKAASEEGFGDLAENLGVDRRIGKFGGGELVDFVATAGAGTVVKRAKNVIDKLPPGGMLPQLAAVSNVPTPTKLVPQVTKGGVVMKAITATDEEVLGVVGRKTGETIASNAQLKVLTKRRSEVQKYENKLVTLREELAEAAEFGEPPKVLDDIRDKIGDAEEMLSRRQSNVLIPDSDDPLWYKSSNSKAAKKLEQTRRKMVGTYLEEHHIFPKGMSAAFFNRMDELIASGVAEADDLLLMAEYAAKSGVKAGDVKSNLVNLMKNPHNELHQILRAQGDEIGKQQWQKILSKVDTVDDALVLWKDVIGRNVKPNAETARIWQPLNDLVNVIQKGL